MSVITGEARWAFVNHTNNKYPKNDGGTYQIDIINLTPDQVDQLKGEGLKPLNKGDDRGDYYSFKRHEKNAKGELNKKPEVTDSSGQNFAGNIGNGSVVDVRYKVFEWNNSFGKGLSADLQKTRIRELVVYEGDGSDEEFEEIEGGFVASAGTTTADDSPFDLDDAPEKVAG